MRTRAHLSTQSFVADKTALLYSKTCAFEGRLCSHQSCSWRPQGDLVVAATVAIKNHVDSKKNPCWHVTRQVQVCATLVRVRVRACTLLCSRLHPHALRLQPLLSSSNFMFSLIFSPASPLTNLSILAPVEPLGNGSPCQEIPHTIARSPLTPNSSKRSLSPRNSPLLFDPILP